MPTSGLSNTLPAVLKAPIYFDKLDLVNNILCYVIRDYGTIGLSVVIYRVPSDDQTHVTFGDWQGKAIDLESPSEEHKELAKYANKFINEHLRLVINVMHHIKICQAQYFLAIKGDELIMTDIQTSSNVMTGPGMVRDIFAKVIPTQEVLAIKPIDGKAKEAILNNSGSFNGDIILKPSKFRLNDETQSPLYVRIVR